MDLNIITDSTLDTATLIVTDPRTGEDTDIRIELNSPDSKAFQAVSHKLAYRRLDMSSKRRTVSAEKAEQDNIQFLAENTVGWQGVEENGQTVPFTTSKAVELYTKFRWLRDQVDSFMGERKNFFKR